jgi:hypothetical protein
MKPAKVSENRTIDEFLYNWQISKDVLLALNPDVKDNLEKALNAKIRSQTRPSFYGIESLNIPDDAQRRGAETNVAASEPEKPSTQIDPVEPNPDFDWLTYETRFNARDYKKLKGAVGYGLYVLPLDDDAEIVASEKLPDILVEAFFPQITKERLLEISAATTRWRKSTTKSKPAEPGSPSQSAASRSTSKLRICPSMVMPYNILANDINSAAIGTELSTIKPGPSKPDMVGDRLVKTWTMWETASRSSIVQIESMKDSNNLKIHSRQKSWPFRKPPDPPTPSLKGKPFKLTDQLPNCFSVKTGVRWIGSKPQGSGDPGGGKDVLETNALLASMRSDWVEYVEKEIGKDPKLVVLRELLTVTYSNQPAAFENPVRDGYQVRDLSDLKSDCLYFPPLSIPFGGQQFVTAYNQKHPSAQKNFTEFWRVAYAEAIGIAKAKLLLRYGLQLTTPNPQNFLLEFDKGTMEPTGTVVIRDIGDAKLHSEVIQQIKADQPAIEYELNGADRPHYLPAQTNNEGRVGDAQDHTRFAQYPLNTRFHWHQYSTFKSMYGGANLPEQEITTVDWGRAHNLKYVETVAQMLDARELAIPIYGEETLQAIHDDSTDLPMKFKSIMQDARKILPEMRTSFGSMARVDVNAWRAKVSSYSLRSIYQCEWALEVFADELLHSKLKSPTITAKIKDKWGKW